MDAIYIATVFLACLVAIRDMQSIPPWRQVVFQRALTPPAIAWLIACLVVFVPFWFVGSGLLILPLIYAVLPLLLLPAGEIASVRSFMPGLATSRDRWRRSGTAARLRNTSLVFIPVALLPILFTVGLFHFLPWRVDEGFRKAVEERLAPNNALLLSGLLMISASVGEEVLYRFYLMPRISQWVSRLRGGNQLRDRMLDGGIALVVTSALFALAHGGMVDPAWMKYAETFVLGGCLGLLRVSLGIEFAIAAHLIFNAAMFLAAGLVA